MGVDQDLGPLSWGLTITFFTLCAVSFALRVYARGFVFRSFAWDDRFMAIAFVRDLAYIEEFPADIDRYC